MCRMLMGNYSGIMEYMEITHKNVNYPDLKTFLEGLELRNGGHGNGYATFRNGKLLELEKGVNLEISQVAKAMKTEVYDWFLFHTREAGFGGSVSDANCHPFNVKGKKEIVAAANGCEENFIPVSGVKGITDSEFVLRMISEMELPLLDTFKVLRSNYFGFYDGKPFVYKGDYGMLKWQKNEGIIFASDFPFGLNNLLHPAAGYFWFDGEESGDFIAHR